MENYIDYNGSHLFHPFSYFTFSTFPHIVSHVLVRFTFSSCSCFSHFDDTFVFTCCCISRSPLALALYGSCLFQMMIS